MIFVLHIRLNCAKPDIRKGWTMLHTLDDHFHEECGVFGIYGDREAAEKT